MEKGVYVDEQYLAREIGTSGVTKAGTELLFVRIKAQFFQINPDAQRELRVGSLLAIGRISPVNSASGHTAYRKLEYLAALTISRISNAPNGDWLVQGNRDTHYRREFV